MWRWWMRWVYFTPFVLARDKKTCHLTYKSFTGQACSSKPMRPWFLWLFCVEFHKNSRKKKRITTTNEANTEPRRRGHERTYRYIQWRLNFLLFLTHNPPTKSAFLLRIFNSTFHHRLQTVGLLLKICFARGEAPPTLLRLTLRLYPHSRPFLWPLTCARVLNLSKTTGCFGFVINISKLLL